jgi:hypothetical protein
MNKFLNTLKRNDTVTENLMTTHSTSLSALVDFFGKAGSARKMDPNEILDSFSRAFNENPDYAMKLLFWARDIRGGSGERRLFKIILAYFANIRGQELAKNVQYIPEYGRWDDLLVLFGTPLEPLALKVIAAGLNEGNGLCAKWMPRKGPHANKIRAYLQLTPKQYRKKLVSLTQVVEQLMCANEFGAINYNKLPSLAAARYQKAFDRHDSVRYNAYKAGLITGKSKISAKAVYPYDITKSLRYGDATVANAQWTQLPDYLEGSEEKNILPVVDVSGSMIASASGSNVSCMDISISLGLYLSERNRGVFKDHFITFSGRPQLQHLYGDLTQRYRQLQNADWGMNTNIEAVFDLILTKAVKARIPVEDMPTQILILSDMQFDQCTGQQNYNFGYGYGYDHNCKPFGPNVVEMAKQKYERAGYKCPELIFWNLRAISNQSPVQVTDTGVALVSGFSPAIMKNILAASNIAECQVTPLDIMMNVINSPRYAVIGV